MFKKIILIVLVLATLVFIGFHIVDEPLPEGEKGPRAEWLAEQMLIELNEPAWDSLKMISWSHPMGHHYIWDKANNQVEVSWDEYKVQLSPDDRIGTAWKNGEIINEESEAIIEKALSYFFNDSFWLIAPYKVRDPGTVRKVVNYEGKEALLVQYTTGGVTPGDSYLWLLDNDYRPVAWKFWVNILPIGGMEFSWENWQDVNGAQISTFHDGLIDIEITNLKYE